MDKLLEIKGLTVNINGKRVIDDASLGISSGKVTALVGESGSGKTMTALAMLKLLPGPAKIEKGEIIFRGSDILKKSEKELQKIRGKDIAIVFQEPFTALNPVMRIKKQIEEVMIEHKKIHGKEIRTRLRILLDMVRLPEDTLFRYPHELSGGMCQRAMLAMALSCSPDILILDEPTTALDVSVQKEILDLIKQIQRNKGLGVLFITHDFSVVNMIADDICVMKDGIIVESGSKEDVLFSAKHEYTRHLIGCIPRLGDKRKRFPV
ncbi:MAG: ABC transporter ATP-binding protein [Candidatus Omnitrophota bacterium]